VWDDVDCAIHDNKVQYFTAQVGDTSTGTEQERGPLHEERGNQPPKQADAKNLFAPHDDEPILDALDRRIEHLGNAINTSSTSFCRKQWFCDLLTWWRKRQWG
jgi:hypothetical protein